MCDINITRLLGRTATGMETCNGLLSATRETVNMHYTKLNIILGMTLIAKKAKLHHMHSAEIISTELYMYGEQIERDEYYNIVLTQLNIIAVSLVD